MRRSPGSPRFAAIACFVVASAAAALAMAGASASALPQESKQSPRDDRRGGRGGPEGVFHLETPDREVDIVAGRPTQRSALLSVRATRDVEGYVEVVGADPPVTTRTPQRRFPGGMPVEVRIDELAPDRAYAAQFIWRTADEPEWRRREPIRLRTQRAPGSTFTFAVQADSHLDTQTQPALYEQTLRNAAAAAPDFLFDLGDTFMVDKRRDDYRRAAPQYPAQRWYLGLVKAPIFLVLGNHDGEVGWRGHGAAEGMTAWSFAQRALHFPNPVDDDFYSTPDAPAETAGQSCYAFEWGAALFVALDPFRATTMRKGSAADGWSWTLGTDTHSWLERVLAASRAKFRFVMIHHLVGGLGPEGRGGAEAAALYEWGGKSADGVASFATKRPGWSAPIHELLRRSGPTIVLHGHDHFWAQQEFDGVVYQMVPQPGHPGGDAARMAAEYGYRSGEFRPSPGFVRITVAPSEAKVELVRTVVGAGVSRAGERNGDIAASYVVRAAVPK